MKALICTLWNASMVWNKELLVPHSSIEIEFFFSGLIDNYHFNKIQNLHMTTCIEWLKRYRTNGCFFFQIDEHSIHLPNLSGLQSNCNNGGEFIAQLLLFPLEKAIFFKNEVLLLLLLEFSIIANINETWKIIQRKKKPQNHSTLFPF